MEKNKEKDKIRIGIELTIDIPETGKRPKMTFHVNAPKKKPT